MQDRAGAMSGPCATPPAEARQPVMRSLFDVGLGEGGHCGQSNTPQIASAITTARPA